MQWHNLPGYCLLTEQALKMWASYSRNNLGVLVWCCSKAISLMLQHFILYTFFPGHCFNCLQFLSCFMSYVFFQQISANSFDSMLLATPPLSCTLKECGVFCAVAACAEGHLIKFAYAASVLQHLNDECWLFYSQCFVLCNCAVFS